jgi:hypothetical protein
MLVPSASLRLLLMGLVCLMLVCNTPRLAAAAPEDPEAQLTPEELVLQLGDPLYAQRERAREELQRRSFAAQPALEGGLAHEDLEIRYRCEQLLVDIREQAIQNQLDAFLRDVNDPKEYDLPGWEKTREALGNSLLTRQLYVEMYRTEGETLKMLDGDPARLGTHIEARAKLLQARRTTTIQAGLDLGNIAALLLAAGMEKTDLSPSGRSMVYQLCHQQAFREGMQGSQSPSLRKLLGRYVLQSDGVYAYQGMTLTMQFNMTEEGLACADKVLSGMLAVPHYRQYAILTIAKLGNESHIEKLLPLLDDKSVCSQQQINKVTYKTELRDVALFAMIHLSKQDPKKFGFDRFSPNPQMVANVHTLGFDSEEKRQAVRDNWAKFQVEQSEAKAAAQDQPKGSE